MSSLKNTALLVIDMQEAFLSIDVCKSSFEIALPTVNKAIAKFRDANAPVVFARTSEANKLNISGGYEIISQMRAEKDDVYIDKDFPNAFWKTSLDANLMKDPSLTPYLILPL